MAPVRSVPLIVTDELPLYDLLPMVSEYGFGSDDGIVGISLARAKFGIVTVRLVSPTTATVCVLPLDSVGPTFRTYVIAPRSDAVSDTAALPLKDLLPNESAYGSGSAVGIVARTTLNTPEA